MPAPSNSGEFLQLLELSKLVEIGRLRPFLDKLGDVQRLTPAQFAESFVKGNLITRFQAEQLLAGRKRGFFIGKYKILDLIGSGGMGRVYLAEHAIMCRQVALKVLPKGKSSDPSALGRFRREARAVAALRHPNIIQAYDIDQEGDIHFIVMEYVDGISVQEYVRRLGPMPPEVAADIVAQACDALDHANQSGLIHRDIKPGNLIVDTSGTVKLLDMGLAVFFEEKDRDPLTLEYDENVLGTADYLAPEQALDSHNVDIRADIYSLGGTFYYMLTGRAPFPEGTIAQKLLWHQNKDPQPIAEIVPRTPAILEKVVRKMMAKDPQNRFQTPHDVRDVLLPIAKRDPELFGQDSARRDIKQAAMQRSISPPPPPSDENDRADPVRNRETASPDSSVRQDQVTGDAVIQEKPGGDGKKRRRSNKTAVPTEVIASSDLAAQLEDASVLTAKAPSSNVMGDSADFLRSLAETTTSSSSRVTRTNGPSQSAIEVLREQLQDPSKRRLIWVGAATAGGLTLLLFPVLWLIFRRPPTPSGPTAVVTSDTKIVEAVDASTLVVSKDPSEKEFLFDEALYEVKRGQKIRLKASGPTTWEISNLRIEAGTIVAEEVSLIGGGQETILKLPKSLDGPVVSISDTPAFVLADLVLDGNGKQGPVLEIIGPRASGVTIRNVTIRNFKGDAIRLTNVQGKANQPVLLENVVVIGTSPKDRGVVFAAPAGGSSGRSYYARLANCKVQGPFAVGLAIEQPINSLVVESCLFAKGTAAIGLFAKEMDWAKVQITKTTFQSLELAVISRVGDAAIAHLTWNAPKFEEVKNTPQLTVSTGADREDVDKQN